jgi:hypothetical protein
VSVPEGESRVFVGSEPGSGGESMPSSGWVSADLWKVSAGCGGGAREIEG